MKLLAPIIALVGLVVALVRRWMPRRRVAPPKTGMTLFVVTDRAEEAKAEVTAETAEAVAPHVAHVEAVKVEVEEAKTTDRAKRRKALRELAKRVDQ